MRVALDNLIRNAWKYTSRHDVALLEFGAARIQRRGIAFTLFATMARDSIQRTQ